MLRSTFPPMASTLNIKSKTLDLVCKNIHSASKVSPSTVRQNTVMNSAPSYFLPPASAYIHLPFCRKRCHYCDFPIVALGSSSPFGSTNDDPRIVNYVELICREIEATRLTSDAYQPLRTVFFGGGTPSLVPPRLVAVVIEILSSKFGVCPDAEISMEMDPGTFDREKLKQFKGLGINRVSLGVQAFQDELLKHCGRAHGIKDVFEAIETMKSCGVENWSMDLISSLPHQTPQMWEESLSLTIDSQPTHVSVYDLQVEEGTKFGVTYKPGEFPLPSDNQSATFYRMASSALTNAGYNHYEISSYGKEGFECKHNQVYWQNKSFYGFGLGSASYVDGVRFSRPRRMKEYTNFVQDLEIGRIKLCENDDVDPKERATDVIMLSLRTSRGLDIESFGQVFGASVVVSLCRALKPYVESGHVLCLDQHRNIIAFDELMSLLTDKEDGQLEEVLGFIRLSDPDGFLLSNELISVAFGAVSP